MKNLASNIYLEDTEYRGVSSAQSDMLIGDFIDNKEKVVQAIIDKGGKADISDSMKKLANKITQLLPAKPVFNSSVNLNPYWHNLSEVAGNNYRSDIPHMWIMLFSKSVKNVLLAGAECYVCSDGFYATQTQDYTFKESNDKYDTQWIIFYGKEPQYNFNPNLKGFVHALLFYNTNPTGININGLGISTSIQFVNYENLNINISGWAQGNNMCIISFEDVKNINIPADCFVSCTYLNSLPIPEGVESIHMGSNCMRASGIMRIATPRSIRSLIITSPFYLSKLTEFIIQDTVDAVVSLGPNNAGTFPGNNLKVCHIGKTKELSIGRYTFNAANVDHLHIESPSKDFSMDNRLSLNITNITLGENWNHPIALNNITTQTPESMYQNIHALADRTGSSPFTFTFGTAKLNTLLSEYPDAAQIAINKNWNLA